MRRTGVYLSVVCMALLGTLLVGPAAAQEEEGNIAFVVFLKAKPGMEQQFEEGMKRHRAWHRQQNDPDAWLTWQIISGENTGTYGTGTFGHRWEDFDSPGISEEADTVDRRQNLDPYTESAVVRYYRRMAEVSRPAEGEAPLAEVWIFRVRYGQEGAFTYAVRKFHEAIEKTQWPVHYNWYQLLNGGEHPTYVVVLPRTNWADFKPPEERFEEILEEAYGRQEAQSLLKSFGKAVGSQRSEIIQNRADLSYVPESR